MGTWSALITSLALGSFKYQLRLKWEWELSTGQEHTNPAEVARIQLPECLAPEEQTRRGQEWGASQVQRTEGRRGGEPIIPLQRIGPEDHMSLGVQGQHNDTSYQREKDEEEEGGRVNENYLMGISQALPSSYLQRCGHRGELRDIPEGHVEGLG